MTFHIDEHAGQRCSSSDNENKPRPRTLAAITGSSDTLGLRRPAARQATNLPVTLCVRHVTIHVHPEGSNNDVC